MERKVLHHERVTVSAGMPDRWLFVLHGIYGAGRNWASVVRRVVRERPEWGGELVDLREHGSSGSFPPPQTIEAAAADLDALVRSLDLSADAVLGHSFGGKVAMMYARNHGGVGQLWIIDSTPDARPPAGSAARMLEIVRRHAGPFPTRESAVRALEGEGLSTPIAQWMATNVGLVDGEYRWRLDFDALEALLKDFFRTDLWDVVEAPPPGLEIHFVKAEGSDILTEEACDRIEAAGRETGRVFLHRVAGGHWVNAENPDAIVELLVANLADRQKG